MSGMEMQQPGPKEFDKAIKSMYVSDTEQYFIMPQKRNILKILRRYWIMLFFYLICPLIVQVVLLPAIIYWGLYFNIFSKSWAKLTFSKFALFLYTGIFAVFSIIIGIIIRPYLYELLKNIVEIASSIAYTLFK